MIFIAAVSTVRVDRTHFTSVRKFSHRRRLATGVPQRLHSRLSFACYQAPTVDASKSMELDNSIAHGCNHDHADMLLDQSVEDRRSPAIWVDQFGAVAAM